MAGPSIMTDEAVHQAKLGAMARLVKQGGATHPMN